MLNHIFEKIKKSQELTKADAMELLDINNGTEEYYQLLGLANRYSRKQFDGKGLIFAQIGLDAQPCEVNCNFALWQKMYLIHPCVTKSRWKM